jgi:hypothetical protein
VRAGSTTGGAAAADTAADQSSRSTIIGSTRVAPIAGR